ncbi:MULTISPECIES: hypothetical protein [Streptomyces]|uniref:hypothetical protein n=1 Tax=Streptomyces TaxID=1883 RepID=UPI0004CA7658|nr:MULTISPECIES: hypothetical protein [Streptomyces]RPK91197.1 hypothetical protein EES46_11225 [Streptomyces sp. ADI98-10]
MRLRTAAASAALVLCAAAGAAACSSSSDAVDAERPTTRTGPASVEGLAESIETGERRTGPPELTGQSVPGPEKCATSVAEIPAECAIDPSFAGFTEGEQAAEPPSLP